ncbi:MAG: glycosyltransferase family 2 protein [Balneola sp.]
MENTASDKPTVTIAIPVLNEEKYIEDVINSFLNSTYSNIIEILIADGGSTDKTTHIVNEISEKDHRIKLLENPEKYQSFALNKMINVAEGDLFLRADSHCEYAHDYVEKCVECMLKTDAENVGGAQNYKAESLIQAGIAIAVKNFFGNGGAKYMDESFEGYADTVFLGCFKTRDLRQIGGFSEENHTNEDAELNLRLKKLLSGKIYVSPSIRSWYYPRKSFPKLFMQYFRYGRGRYITNKKHDGDIPYRSKAPFIFLSFMVLFGIMDFILEQDLGFIYVSSAILLLVFFESVRFSYEKKEYLKQEIWTAENAHTPPILIITVLCFLSLVIMNIAHFFGYGWQAFKSLFTKGNSW